MSIKKFLAIILSAVLVSYSFNLLNEYSIDDIYYISQLEQIHSLSDLPKVLYIPFSIADYRPGASLLFAIEKVFIGDTNPYFSHFINLFLYLICIFIFFKILQLITENKHIIYISTALFSILPLHTSMIANVKNRDGLMSFILGGLALYFFIKISSQCRAATKIAYLILCIFSITLAIFFKLDALMFLLMIPLVFIIMKNKIDIKFLSRSIILFMISYKLINILFEFWWSSKKQLLAKGNFDIDQLSDELLFTENPLIKSDHLLDKFSFTIQTIFEYMIMIFKPSHHYFYYGYDVIPVYPITHPIIIIKAIILLIIAGSAVYLIKSKPLYSFGILSMFLTLSYCSNLFQPVAGIVADRYAFIASMGASIAMGALIFEIYTRLKSKYSWNITADRFSWGVIGAVFIFYIPFNVVRSQEWKNILTLIEADMPALQEKSFEANRIAMSNYIEAGFDEQNINTRNEYLNNALTYGNNALRIYDKYYLAHEGVALAYFGLGRFEEAKIKALFNIANLDTTLETTYRILADIYTKENKNDSLAWIYKKIQKVYPNEDFNILKVAEYLYKDDQKEEAIIYCDSILQVHPERGGAYQGKAYIYFDQKDSLKGAVNSEKAFELGIRDHILLDATGNYWWSRDQVKWEDMKKYVQ